MKSSKRFKIAKGWLPYIGSESVLDIWASGYNPVASKWLLLFSRVLDSVYESGEAAGVNVDDDAQVSSILQKVRGRLLCHATREWIAGHSTRLVRGMEERICRAEAVPAPAALSAPQPESSHQTRLLATSRGISSSSSPSHSVVPPPFSQLSAGLLPTASSPATRTGSIPSPSSLLLRDVQRTPPAPLSPTVVSPAPGAVPSVPVAASSSTGQPHRLAAVIPSAALVESPPVHKAGAKRGRSPNTVVASGLVPTSFVWCDHCTRSKVKCEPVPGADPLGPCFRCSQAKRDCVRSLMRSRCKTPPRTAASNKDGTSTHPVFEVSGVALDLLIGDPIATSGVPEPEIAALRHWCIETSRSSAMLRAAEEYHKYVYDEYLKMCERAEFRVSDRPAKRAKFEGVDEKGKSKESTDEMEAIDVDEIGSEMDGEE
ncbi:hypothetical protein EI94DRAFT_1833187 [Lactarius quietus]|nr:hypothetical protein EI94DRAFT_1833187 [Lactarius quietus]